MQYFLYCTHAMVWSTEMNGLNETSIACAGILANLNCSFHWTCSSQGHEIESLPQWLHFDGVKMCVMSVHVIKNTEWSKINWQPSAFVF